MRRIHGFTIVELLIVVVVIGILAAISIVAYNGVSQKANNAAIIDAAGKTQRLMQAYIATEGKYPLPGPTTMFACVTTETGCRSSTEDFPEIATFDANMASVGQLPRSIPFVGDGRYGIYLTYWSSAVAGPFYMRYYLQGVNQQCGLSGVLNANIDGYATTGYTNGNHGSSGKTECTIKVPGPPHAG